MTSWMSVKGNVNLHISFWMYLTKKWKMDKISDELLNLRSGQMKNMFYLEENSSRSCTEGAIGNLMNMLHCSTEDMNLFWELATSNLS
jgi:hypothetical protein